MMFNKRAPRRPQLASHALFNEADLRNSPEPDTFMHGSLDLSPSQQCIRLLRIIRKCRGIIYCQLLNNMRLVDKPKCVALSYEWGSRSEPQQLIVNGKSMMIQKNLHAFLHAFIDFHQDCSDGREPSLLWIDAISIRQSRNDERNHQVS
jgi:hypothetical protein